MLGEGRAGWGLWRLPARPQRPSAILSEGSSRDSEPPSFLKQGRELLGCHLYSGHSGAFLWGMEAAAAAIFAEGSPGSPHGAVPHAAPSEPFGSREQL